MTIFAKVGGCKFQTPVKPKPAEVPPPPPAMLTRIRNRVIADDEELGELAALLREWGSYQMGAGASLPFLNGNNTNVSLFRDSDELVPDTEGTEGLAGDGEPDVLDQDDFWLRFADIGVPVDAGNPAGVSTPRTVKIIPPQLTDGWLANGSIDWNQITEKVSRYTLMVPTGTGRFGPSFGTYKLVSRLPVTVGANLRHICLSQDYADIIAEIVTGVTDILSIGGAQLFPIGALSSHGLAEGRNVTGGPPCTAVTLPGTLRTAECSLPSDCGEIAASRFVEFYYTYQSPTQPDSDFPSIMLAASDVVGIEHLPKDDSDVPFIPVSIWVNLKDLKWEWQVFDRSLDMPVISSDVTVPFEAAAIAAQAGLKSKHPAVRSRARKVLKRCHDGIQHRQRRVSLADLNDEVEITTAEVETMRALLVSRLY